MNNTISDYQHSIQFFKSKESQQYSCIQFKHKNRQTNQWIQLRVTPLEEKPIQSEQIFQIHAELLLDMSRVAAPHGKRIKLL